MSTDTQNRTKIINIIKKKPFIQKIQGVQYVYSLLSKRQRTFLGTNDRFLILKSQQSIGYSRNLPQESPLPFRSEMDIPKNKLVYSLEAVKKCKAMKDELLIQFNFDQNAKWEFVCRTQACAQEWARIINNSIEKRKHIYEKKFEKYEIGMNRPFQTPIKQIPQQQWQQQYPQTSPQQKIPENPKPNPQIPPQPQLHLQQQQQQQQQLNRNPSLGILRAQTLQQQSKKLNKSKSDLQMGQSQGVIVKVPDRTQKQIIQDGPRSLFRKKAEFGDDTPQRRQKNHTLIDSLNMRNQNGLKGQDRNARMPMFQQKRFGNKQSFQNSHLQLTPITHNSDPKGLYSIPQQLSKIQQIFLQKTLQDSPSQHLLNKSISTISVSGKQQLKSTVLSQRRQWLQQLLSKQEQSELIIDFKRYSKKIVEVIINELHIADQQRIFKQNSWNNQFASYIVEDVYVEVYFYSEEQIESKHRRYQKAVKQFKNYDYFLQVTQHQNLLYVPLMTIFEYKGFVGMVKTIIPQSNDTPCNKEFYQQLDRQNFQQQSGVSSQILLNQSKCKIIRYRKNNFLSKLVTDYQNNYFLQKLQDFLPQQKSSNITVLQNLLLRPQLMQDEVLQDYIFGKKDRDASIYDIQGIIGEKVKEIVESLESQAEYFTNSQELGQIIHGYGLNIRHLGLIYKKITQNWLKQQIKAEMAARSLKTLFRFDLQSCILNQIQRMNTKQKQSQRQIKRVMSFLNVVFGNSEATFRVWKGLNNYSQKHYGSVIWQQTYTDINKGYFLQAIQYHLKILLSENILQKELFSSMKTVEQKDFIRFQIDVSTYNLDYTQNFEEINECLQQINHQNFQQLCKLITHQTKSKKNYIQILKGLPIYDRINEYLLNFISPRDSEELYNKLQQFILPKKFIYQSKIAQIKWCLKENRFQLLQRSIRYIQQHAKKWLGNIHPLFVTINRILSQFYCGQRAFYHKAVDIATKTIEIQLQIHGGESPSLWKDFNLLGKIHFQQDQHQNALPNYLKSKKLVNLSKNINPQLFSEFYIQLSKCFISSKMYKQAYLNIRQLYNLLKQQITQQLLPYILESVSLIRVLLENNQQYQSFYRFIETDFCHIVYFFSHDPQQLKKLVQLVFLPHLKSILFQKSKNKTKANILITELSKNTQSSMSSIAYLQQKIRQRKFPLIYLQYLKQIDTIIEQIFNNQMLQRWSSFSKMSKQSLLQKIGTNQINRSFQFLADLSALIGVLQRETLGQLSLMQI